MTKYNAQLVSGLGLIISAFIPRPFQQPLLMVGSFIFAVPLSPTRVKSHRNSDSWRCLVRIITGCKRAWSATRMP
jgi:accessory gene regulator protein AgrB